MERHGHVLERKSVNYIFNLYYLLFNRVIFQEWFQVRSISITYDLIEIHILRLYPDLWRQSQQFAFCEAVSHRLTGVPRSCGALFLSGSFLSKAMPCSADCSDFSCSKFSLPPQLSRTLYSAGSVLCVAVRKFYSGREQRIMELT